MHDTSWWLPAHRRYAWLDDPAAALPPPLVPRRSALGFEWAAYRGVAPASSVRMPPFPLYRIVGVPHWFLAAATAIGPARSGADVWRRRRRRLRHGLCPACGYDLRASPGRCLQCGATLPDGASPDPPLQRAGLT